ncbi:MAG: O-methyltransferase [Candidatus Izemoplasmatales bacterium]|uniref:tRNA 5-hydroxyuridine methyltransferase n=1 Tax=Hujiaoplasma nucleasis TaxID=2725268 RepID=A0A7L6N313_9MOLU|nr:O-methyltransferase [Hujiaoplasma nucleasis]QLY39455.1 O-methyltransferase [Hujiaoplasma nucleasis]
MINAYLKSLNQPLVHPMVDLMKKQALNDHVPIITDEGIRFLIQLLKIKNAKKVLEIGTAIGYSSILMALFTHVDITTIERDEKLFKIAEENINKANLQKKIKVILADAHDVSINDQDYDLLFIDAAKASYIDFFEKFSKNVSTGGVIVTDNLLFRGLVASPQGIESKNRLQLVKKINKFNEYIIKQEDYDTYIYPIGDGMSISIKK